MQSPNIPNLNFFRQINASDPHVTNQKINKDLLFWNFSILRISTIVAIRISVKELEAAEIRNSLLKKDFQIGNVSQ
jgi:hypothetical protein